jgi:phosphoribosylformylglycinamidine cyclo-ligase
MAHITGGGIPGNLPRVLPDGLGARITASWARPPIFDFIQKRGPIDEKEMRSTFNCGVGFVLVVSKDSVSKDSVKALGEGVTRMGEIVRVPAETAFEHRVDWG